MVARIHGENGLSSRIHSRNWSNYPLNSSVIKVQRHNCPSIFSKVYFEGDDDLSHAVKRLEQLSSYDNELDNWNNMRSTRQDR